MHNACADLFNPGADKGFDLCVTTPAQAKVCFDAGSADDRIVYEVKVNRFSTYNPFLKRQTLSKNSHQAVRQWANAVVSCNLTVFWVAADAQHSAALVKHPGFTGVDGLVRTVVHAPQCLTAPDQDLPEEDRPNRFSPQR